MGFREFFQVVDFFVPSDVFTAVLMVFTLEKLVEYVFYLYVPEGLTWAAYGILFVVTVILLGVYNIYAADKEELEELEEDLEDLRD